MVACQPDAGDDLPEPPPEDVPTVTPPEDDPTDTPPVEEPEPTEIELSAKYVLIRPDEKNETEVKATLLLERALESIYGEKFSIATDYPPKGEDDEDTFEILIGETNREATEEAILNSMVCASAAPNLDGNIVHSLAEYLERIK
jgi:hypothetical protein